MATSHLMTGKHVPHFGLNSHHTLAQEQTARFIPRPFSALGKTIGSFLKGLITWRVSARDEISTLPTGLKFCCDYMTDFSWG